VTRRSLIAALAIAPQLRAQETPSAIAFERLQWEEFIEAFNKFAALWNVGVNDKKLWANVLKKIHAIEGKSCKEK
jgi:hypothetical protein